MTYSKKELERHIVDIAPKGFIFKKDIQVFQFIKKHIDRYEEITICYKQYPSSYYINGITVDLYYKDVENLLEEAYEKSKVEKRHGQTGTIWNSLIKVPEVNYLIFDTEIIDEKSLLLVLNEVQKIINNAALPFFHKYNTLDKVYEDSEKMTIDEMMKFIGQPLPLRRIILKKICNDSEYEKYYKKIVDNFSKKKYPEFIVVKEIYKLLNEVDNL